MVPRVGQGAATQGRADRCQVRQALTVYGSDPSLCESVQIDRTWGRANHFDTVVGKKSTECRRILRVAVDDPMPFAEERPGFAVHPISRRQHPRLPLVCRDSTQGHSASSHFDHEEEVLSCQALPTPPLDRKEATGRQGFPVCLEKRRPGNVSAARGRRFNQVIFENTADRPAPHFDLQIEQCTVNSRVAPARILVGHPHNELLGVDLSSRSSRPTPLQECPALRHPFAVPAQKRRGADDWIEISQRLSADFICERSERATFSLRKQDAPPCESRSQRAVLGLQVVDLRAGLSLEPTGHARDD